MGYNNPNLEHQKKRKKILHFTKSTYICSPFSNKCVWELSSAGSEHLPYKQGVTGSNPVAPTKPRKSRGFFVLRCTTFTYYSLNQSTNFTLDILETN